MALPLSREPERSKLSVSLQAGSQPPAPGRSCHRAPGPPPPRRPPPRSGGGAAARPRPGALPRAPRRARASCGRPAPPAQPGAAAAAALYFLVVPGAVLAGAPLGRPVSRTPPGLSGLLKNKHCAHLVEPGEFIVNYKAAPRDAGRAVKRRGQVVPRRGVGVGSGKKGSAESRFSLSPFNFPGSPTCAFLLSRSTRKSFDFSLPSPTQSHTAQHPNAPLPRGRSVEAERAGSLGNAGRLCRARWLSGRAVESLPNFRGSDR